MKISETRFLNYLWFISIFFLFIGCTGSYTPKGADTYKDTTVVATPSSDPLVVQVNTSSNVTVTFNVTDSQNPARDLVIDSFTLPEGWTWVTAVPNFGDKSKPYCRTVGIGNCSLTLKFSPVGTTSTLTSAAPYTFSILFSYLTTDGTHRKTKNAIIQYRITTNNTLDTVVNPTTVLTTVGTALPVDVLFSSSDINPVTNVMITGGLSSLPAGWTNITTLPLCTQIASAINTTPPTVPIATCTKTLKLRYNPTNIANSSFTITYTYTANNGVAKSVSKVINYRATSNNTLNVSLSQSSLDAVIYNPNSYFVTATFNSSDGNPVTNFSISFDGTGGSTGWSITGDSCTGASSITSCQITLYYDPISVTTGTNSIAMAYTYTSNSGFPQGSGFGINYTASYNSINFYDSSLTQITSFDFSSVGTQYFYLTTNDMNSIFDLSISLGSTPPLSINGTNCPTNYGYSGIVSPLGNYSCYVAIDYDGTSNGSSYLLTQYTPYSGPYLGGETSLNINYSVGDILTYSYITGSLENTAVGGSNYIIYLVTIPSYNIYQSYLNSDSTSYPSDLGFADSSSYGYYPSCDSNGSYYGYCYVAFKYAPTFLTSGSFDYNAQYATYDSQYYTFWTYRNLFIPGITYSSVIPLGNITYNTWVANTSGNVPPSPDLLSSSTSTYISQSSSVNWCTSGNSYDLTINAPSGYTMSINNLAFGYVFNSVDPVNYPNTGTASINSNTCGGFGQTSCTVTIVYKSGAIGPPGSGCTFETGSFDLTFNYTPTDTSLTQPVTLHVSTSSN